MKFNLLENWDRVFIYANQNNTHWVLYEIDVKEQLIILYDSFYHGVTPYSKNQMDILYHFIIDNTKYQNWNVTYNSNCQFQKNGCDCGVFMITFSLFLSDFSAESVDGIDLTELARCKIAMDITRGFINDPRIINNDLLLSEPDDEQKIKYTNNNSTSYFDYNDYVVDVLEDVLVQIPTKEEDETTLKQKKKEIKLKKAKLTIKTQINELNIVKKQLRKLSIENKKLRKMKFSKKSSNVGSEGTIIIFNFEFLKIIFILFVYSNLEENDEESNYGANSRDY
jgi:hypothetical protein